MARPYTIRMTQCGNPIVGRWCDVCALPSAVTVVFLMDNRPMTVTVCRDCGTKS